MVLGPAAAEQSGLGFLRGHLSAGPPAGQAPSLPSRSLHAPAHSLQPHCGSEHVLVKSVTSGINKLNNFLMLGSTGSYVRYEGVCVYVCVCPRRADTDQSSWGS